MCEFCNRRDLLGRAFGDDPAAAFPALRAHVDDPVGGPDHVEVVLDHEQRSAVVDQPFKRRRAAF